MEHVLVGALLAATIGLGLVTWYLYERPDVLLSLLSPDADPEGWFDEGAPALRLVRWLAAATLLGLGFATGFALIFLAATG